MTKTNRCGDGGYTFAPDELITVFRFETKHGDMVRAPVVATPAGPKISSSRVEYEGDPKLVMEGAGFNDMDVTILEYKDETDN